jgi:rhodanese-related sulfurtransferase
MPDIEILPAELKRKLDSGSKVIIIDVREPWEHQICTIAGAKLIPMNTIPANVNALDSGEEIVCYCHHGARSLNVAAWLRQQGIEGARSLRGGIEQWSLEIDPKVARY